MPQPRYGRSPWIDRFPASRVPSYPRHRGRLDVDVAIVGGGLTGCATAYAFAAADIKVALLEHDRIGCAGTASSAGWIADEPGVAFFELEKSMGRRAAVRGWHAWRRAALDFAALIRRLDLKCDLQPCPTLAVAGAPNQLALLRRDLKARRDAGIDTPFVNARGVGQEVALVAAGALRGRDSATLDPYRACLGLASAASARGARLFERSPVTRIRFGRRAVDVMLAGGLVHADHVVIATGAPTALTHSLARHFWFNTTYLALTARVPAKIQHRLGARASVLRDSANPPHVVRWVAGERLLVMGADQPRPPDRRRQRIIVQRTGQLMYELSTLYPDISGIVPDYGWDVAYARTADGLPYIGPHRNFPRHLFAFGDSSHSLTGAYLASRMLLRRFLGEADPAEQSFEFTRHGRDGR